MLDSEEAFTVMSTVDLVFRSKIVSQDLENLYYQCEICGPNGQSH